MICFADPRDRGSAYPPQLTKKRETDRNEQMGGRQDRRQLSVD